MTKSKVKNALLKSFVFTAAAFVLGIVLFALGSIYDGNLIQPSSLLLMVLMFGIIEVINFFRVYFDDTKWARSKPAVVKNFIFAPIYFAIAMIFLHLLLGELHFKELILYIGLFLVIFLSGQVIVYFVSKKKTDLMNDALIEFQKEHGWDEQE